MIDMTNFSLFIAASWALIIAPGPDMIYVITRGIAQGRRAGLLSAVGVTLGILVHTISATLGLAVLLQTSALVFLTVKYLGAVYLLYLGYKTFKDKSSFAPPEPGKIMGFRTIFWQGMLSNVFNPKVALFFLAFLPQFANPDHGYVGLQMLILGLLFALFGMAFLCILGFFAGGIGSWLAKQPRYSDILRWLTGTIFVGLGLRLALVERR